MSTACVPASPATRPNRPEVEVLAKAERRRFTAEYKKQILEEIDAAREPGATGAILRREGLYSSHLAIWRAARKRRELEALAPKRRGPRPKEHDARERRIVALERENARLSARAERAEALIDLQKKVSEILGIQLPKSEERRS